MQLELLQNLGNLSLGGYKMKPKVLQEARRYMTEREIKLRKRLVNLLRDDGKGHHHAKYAERLAKFDLNIVPLKDDPMFTAAISFKDGIIYVGEGFLTDPSMFFQLNVLMRHELAHNLLMHEIRMMSHLGKEAYEQIFGQSTSLHTILNIIMDDEISNKKYSVEDKEIVRNMYLNGRLIGGLVTEDHRADWIDLPVEKLYEKIKAELDTIHAKLVAGLKVSAVDSKGKPDFITSHLLQTMPYRDIDGASAIPGSIDDFVKNGCVISTPKGKLKIAKEYKEIIEAIYNSFTEYSVTHQNLEKPIKQLADSHPTTKFDLIHPETGAIIITLNAPEHKRVAMDTLKKFRSAYITWYNKVLKVLSSSQYSTGQVKEIFRKIGGVKSGN